MEKYSLLPQQLLYEGTITKLNLFKPSVLGVEDILRVHTAEYWEKLNNGKLSKQEIRRTGFPFSPELVLRERTINQGTIECALFAIKYGISMNIAGGTHHAFADRGEGFCLLNDQAIAAAHLLHHKYASKILIIDLDVHQGNGTAKIFENNNDVFTFSMHGENNYPGKKESSDFDIALPTGTGDFEYLSLLYDGLCKVDGLFQPDFIFYQSGVDVLGSDALGKLALTISGTKERDKMVIEFATSKGIPMVVCMGGGYSPKLSTIIEAHANTFRLAQEYLYQ